MGLIGGKWSVAQVDSTEREKLEAELKISPILATLLMNRKIEKVRQWLRPDLEDLHDPFLLPNMDRGIERITQAIGTEEKVIIYGHDDVDGVTSVTLMLELLGRFSDKVDYYIPDRTIEGYGFQRETIDGFASAGVSVIITVDCEGNDREGIAYAKSRGIDVVVTDHHEVQVEVPEAVAVINPKRPDSRYPFRELAGVGVAFKVAEAFCQARGDDRPQFLLDLVTLGSIADRVPLVDENRTLVKLGMNVIERGDRVGIRLIKGEISPCLSLRIPQEMGQILKFGNIGDGKSNVARLLLTWDEALAGQIWGELRRATIRWRRLTDRAGAVALERAREVEDDPLLVVVAEDIPMRMLGHCASLLRNKYDKPVIVIGQGSHGLAGEGRSPEWFDLFQALTNCRERFVQYGGHQQAAGFSILPQQVQRFSDQIRHYAQTQPPPQPSLPTPIDGDMDPLSIDDQFMAELEMLAPFDKVNPEPIFLARDVTLTIGNSKMEFGREMANAQIDEREFYVFLEGVTKKDLGDKSWCRELIYLVVGKRRKTPCLRLLDVAT